MLAAYDGPAALALVATSSSHEQRRAVFAPPFALLPSAAASSSRTGEGILWAGLAVAISGVPIVENGGRLVGIITNRDLQFETELERPIVQVMTSEKLVTVPVGTTLDDAQAILHEHRIEKLPVVDEARNQKREAAAIKAAQASAGARLFAPARDRTSPRPRASRDDKTHARVRRRNPTFRRTFSPVLVLALPSSVSHR